MNPTALISDVTESDFADRVLRGSSTRPVVVDFWAPWCGPCHQLYPILEKVAARHADDVDVVRVNVDEAPAVAAQFQVQGIPAVKAFRDGRVVAELTGVQPEAVVDGMFQQLAPSPVDRLVTTAAQADPQERERLLGEALEADPGHPGAIVALATILIERDDADAARALLERIPGDEDAQRLMASLDLAGSRLEEADLDLLRAEAHKGDAGAALELGRALAATGSHAEALEVLVAAVGDPRVRDDARETIVAVFRILGDDHELVRTYRPKLATALF